MGAQVSISCGDAAIRRIALLQLTKAFRKIGCWSEWGLIRLTRLLCNTLITTRRKVPSSWRLGTAFAFVLTVSERNELPNMFKYSPAHRSLRP